MTVMTDLENTVVLITSGKIDTPEFGSGFPIYQDENSTYLLTCAHVVSDVGGEDYIKISGRPATVVGIGEEQGCDLAILKVDDLIKTSLVKISRIARKGQPIVIAGYSQNETKVKILRRVEGFLGQRAVLELDGTKTTAWDLKISDASPYALQKGYSGSPVVDADTGIAIGIVTQMEGSGRQGLAISIDAVEKVWKNIPDGLLQDELNRLSDEIETSEEEIRGFNTRISEKISQLAQLSQDDTFRESLSWLSDGRHLAEKFGSESLRKIHNPEQYFRGVQTIESFYLDIELYLELIHTSLLTQRLNILHEPFVERSIPILEAYTIALELVKKRIPESITGDERVTLEARFDYLISRLN
jgi:hypothetical protein